MKRPNKQGYLKDTYKNPPSLYAIDINHYCTDLEKYVDWLEKNYCLAKQQLH